MLRPVGIWGHLQGENIQLYNLLSPVMMLLRVMMCLCYVTLRYIMLRYITLCYIMLCDAMGYVTSHYIITLRYVMSDVLCYVLCFVMLRYITLYVPLRYVTSYYVMLC